MRGIGQQVVPEIVGLERQLGRLEAKEGLLEARPFLLDHAPGKARREHALGHLRENAVVAELLKRLGARFRRQQFFERLRPALALLGAGQDGFEGNGLRHRRYSSVASRPAISRPRSARLSTIDVLVVRMRIGAARAEAIERRDTHRAGEIGIRAAAGGAMRQLHAELLGEIPGLLVQRHGAGIRLPDRPRHAARHLKGHVVGCARQLQHPLHATVEIGLALGHAQRLAGAGGGDAIDPLAAVHDADREGAVLRGHAVDLDDRRAISRIAERPEERLAPAWLGLPVASRLKRAIA